MKVRGEESERSRDRFPSDRSGSERVKVHVRLRPFTEDEYIKDRQSCIESFDVDNKSIIVRKDFERKAFVFDTLLDPKSDQSAVYKNVAQPVVQSVLEGYNGTIFAYGQTGTGKTYTILGEYTDERNRGIVPRALEDVFTHTSTDTQSEYDVSIAYLQIYMESVQDLIEPSNNEIKIRESQENGVFLNGISWVPVDSAQESLEVVSIAEKNRITAFTNLNEVSSRSHTVLLVKLSKKTSIQTPQSQSQRSMTEDKSEDLHGNITVHSVLYLVDLAGSERVKKSKVSGDRLEEAISINSSLSVLGKCIHALGDTKRTYVPFRDSKLTRILQDSLGGNSKTALVVNVGPSIRYLDETVSSLMFGARAMKVQNKPHINKQQDYYAFTTQLQMELDNKDEEMQHMQEKVNDMVTEFDQLRRDYEELKLHNYRIELSNDNMRNSLNSGGSREVYEAWEKNKKLELEGLEKGFEERFQKQEEEHKNLLEEIDKMMLDQEHDIEGLKEAKDELNEKVETLTRDLENEREEKTLIMKNMNTVNESISTQSTALVEERDSLKLKVTELEESLAGVDKTNKKEQSVLRTKAQEKDIVISELESQIKELKEREKYSESVLSKEKQKYEEQLQQKDREINRLQCEYKDERSTLTQKVEFAEQNKENCSKAFERKMSDLEISKSSEIQQLKKQLSHQELQKSDTEVSLAELRLNINKLTQENEKMKMGQREKDETNQALQTTIERLEKDCEAVQIALAEKEETIAELSRDMSSVNQTLKAGEVLQLENDELRIKSDDLERTIRQHDDHVTRIRATLKEKEHQVADLKSDIELARKSSERIEQEREMYKEQINALQSKYDDEVEINSRLRDGTSSLCDQVSALQEELTSTKKELNSLRMQGMTLKEENESMVDRNTELENEMNKLFEQLSLSELEYEQVLSKKQMELDLAHKRCQQLEEEAERQCFELTSRLEELRDALSDNQKRTQSLEQENDNLRTQTSRLNTATHSSNQSGQPLSEKSSSIYVRAHDECISHTKSSTVQERNKDVQIRLLNESLHSLQLEKESKLREFKRSIKSYEMLLKTKDLEINEKEKRERIKSQEVVHLTQQVAELNTSVHRYESQLEDFKHSQELSQSSHYEQYFATVDQPIEIEKLKEEVKNYKLLTTQLREKLRILNGDLQMISNSKGELEQEKDAYIDELSQEICKLTLDDLVNNVQLQSLKKEMRDLITAPSEVSSADTEYDFHNCSNLSSSVLQKRKSLATPGMSRKWLKALSKTQNQVFNEDRFNAFTELMSRKNCDYSQTTNFFSDFYSQVSLQNQVFQRHLQPEETTSSLLPEEYAQVKNVLDNVIFIVEVEYEIESKVALDLSAVSIDHHLEGKLNKNVAKYASPSCYSSVQSYRNIGAPQRMTKLEEVPSAEIFAANYSQKIQRTVQDAYYNNVQNYMYCGSRVMERVLHASQELRGEVDGGNKQLLLELSEMVLNSYNYSLYLTNQCDLKDQIIKDMQCMIEIFVGCMATKEIELKISEREKKLILKRLLSTVRHHELDRKELVFFSQRIQRDKQRDEAALKIQRYYREKQRQRYSKMLFTQSTLKLHEEKQKTDLAKTFVSQWGHKTGKLLVGQSKKKINGMFSNLLEIFVDKSSGRYQKYKNLNVKKQGFRAVHNISKLSVKNYTSGYSSNFYSENLSEYENPVSKQHATHRMFSKRSPFGV